MEVPDAPEFLLELQPAVKTIKIKMKRRFISLLCSEVPLKGRASKNTSIQRGEGTNRIK
jgi:hypothetical protein